MEDSRFPLFHWVRGSPIQLSIVLPTYNESKNVLEMVARLTSLLEKTYGRQYEIIIVDDDSPDRTWELAQNLTSEYPRLKVMRRQGERGLSTAVIRGWQAARGQFLGVIDADLQHPPEVLTGLTQAMAKGADIAVASRHIEGGGVSDWSLMRRVVSRTAQLIGLVILPGVVSKVSDPMSGCFLIRRAAIEGVELSPVGYKILIEVLGRGRCRWIDEVPYVFRERVEGESKATRAVYIEYVQHLLRLRLSTLPINRFVRFAAVGLSGVVVDMGVLYLLSDPSTLGWGLTRSKIIAAELAIINNFIWNDAWTFRRCLAASDAIRAASAALRKISAGLFGWIDLEHDSLEPAVQSARNESLPRECNRHRIGHRLEFLVELEIELARDQDSEVTVPSKGQPYAQ